MKYGIYICSMNQEEAKHPKTHRDVQEKADWERNSEFGKLFIY